MPTAPCSGSPYRIGLTGNIATGKTTVGRMLSALRAEVIDADQVAHAVISPDGAAYSSVVAAFGDEIVADDGTIDRQRLGGIVFSDPAALRRLEALVHPPVIEAVERRIVASHAQVVVVEAIKLLESGMADDYDAIWVTTCSEATQLHRLMVYRGLDRDGALHRIRVQPDQAEKLSRADVVINTEGPIEATRLRVTTAWLKTVHGACGTHKANGTQVPADL